MEKQLKNTIYPDFSKFFIWRIWDSDAANSGVREAVVVELLCGFSNEVMGDSYYILHKSVI